MESNTALEGTYQQALAGILARLQNRTGAALGQRAAAHMQNRLGAASQRTDLAARRMGLGEGTRAGSLRGLGLGTARAAADAELSAMDPRRRDQELIQALQLLGNSMDSNPHLATMLSLFGPIEARSQTNAARRSRGSGLGNLLGIASGLGSLGEVFK